MAAPNIHVRVNGSYKRVKRIWTKVNGVWKEVRKVHTRQSGNWKLTFHNSSAFIFNQTISSHTFNYNLRSSAIAAGWNQTSPLIANIVIASGVIVGGGATPSNYRQSDWLNDSSYRAAFDTGGGFPPQTLITIDVRAGAYIVGAGGAGNGGPGSDALRVRYPATISNNGIIGGGGGGAAIWRDGGGAGYPPGPNATIVTGHQGGGGLGQSGLDYVETGPYTSYTYDGGAAGFAVIGNQYITWAPSGDRRGFILHAG